MLKKRIIPTLLFKNNKLVKGINFNSWRTVGSVMQSVRIYKMRKVDELILLDISATNLNKKIDLDLINEVANECFMPLTFGGGVKTIEDISNILKSGADKVCINTASINNLKFIKEACKIFGSQAIVISVDYKKSEAIENRFNIDIGGIDYDAKFVFETIGYNLEGNEVGAAFGLVQLKNLERNIQIRENNFKKQNDFFKNHDKLFLTPKQLEGSKTGWLAYPILISKEAKFSRKEFQIYLEKRNIQTRVVFTGNVIRQPMMKNVKYKEDKSGYLNSDAVMERGVLLPLHHGMTDQMFVRLHDTINEFIKNHC